jgi:hypothetical protein
MPVPAGVDLATGNPIGLLAPLARVLQRIDAATAPLR